jgi:predicted transcriptional regulator
MASPELSQKNSDLEKLAGEKPAIKEVVTLFTPSSRESLERLEPEQVTKLLENLASCLPDITSEASIYIAQKKKRPGEEQKMDHPQRVKNVVNSLVQRLAKQVAEGEIDIDTACEVLCIAARYRSNPHTVLAIMKKVKDIMESATTEKVFGVTEQLFELHRFYLDKDSEAIEKAIEEAEVRRCAGMRLDGYPLDLSQVMEVFELTGGSLDQTSSFFEIAQDLWVRNSGRRTFGSFVYKILGKYRNNIYEFFRDTQ